MLIQLRQCLKKFPQTFLVFILLTLANFVLISLQAIFIENVIISFITMILRIYFAAYMIVLIFDLYESDKTKICEKICIKKIIVITGPTASGKTALAIKLAKKIDAEIICADSRIVYRGLDIVSAKPDIIEQDGVPHHLIDIKDPVGEPYSAGDFANDAKAVIEKNKRKKQACNHSGRNLVLYKMPS